LAVVWVLAPRQDSRRRPPLRMRVSSPSGKRGPQFNVRYYLFALIFVVFDVEVIYLYPWAVVFRQLGPGCLLWRCWRFC